MRLKIWTYCLIVAIGLQALLIGKESSYRVIPDQTSVPILTPSLAKRQTLKLQLSNGLEAYLISDPEATQAGAVLTVQAGSWDDPEEYPGIAHFLEHMLFLGTEKYPIESDYDRFIRAHNGKSNAYTSSDHTLYLFSIDPSAFDEALDRFSFFFKKPLFNPSGVERELHAIDQEFAKNLDQDGFRELYVSKELANVQHPFHRFSIGNSETLSQVTQQTLKEWYQQHYSAHLMRLIVYAPESLDKLKALVLEDFKDIPSTWQEPASPQVSPLAEEMRGKIVYIEPVQDIRSLHLTWELPLSSVHQTSFRPENLICYILGDEGPGSLLAHLRTEGLATELSCGSSHLGKDHLLFSLSISLTPAGLENVFEVIQNCFQAIQSLQHQNLPPYLFDELKKIHRLRYQYQSREDTFNHLMNLGGQMVHEDLSTFPESVSIPQGFDQNLVRNFLHDLTPQRAYFTVLAHHPGITFDQTEQWIKVPYKVTNLSSEQLAALDNLPFYSQLHLPQPNPFIPQDFKLVNDFSSQKATEKVFPHPTVLIDNANAKIYFAADDRFQLPQTMWFFEIKTPFIEAKDPSKVMLADLYIKCLQEALHPYSYPAHVADLSYQISRTTNGILLSLSGYQDNTEILFDAILKNLKNCRPSKQEFESLKNFILNQNRPSSQESPLQQGVGLYHQLLYEFSSNGQQREKDLKSLSYENFIYYMDHLFDQTYTQGLLYGNINQEQALQLWKKLQHTLKSQPFPHDQQVTEGVLVLPAQSGPYLLNLNVQSSANAAVLGIENPTFSFKSRAAQQILAQAMNSAFYSTLRTKQQTGYLVHSWTEDVDQHLFTFFAVQSSTHAPRDLLARFELFIESFLAEMEENELTADQFESIRQSLLNSLENFPQNLTDTGYLLKTLAFQYEGDFDRMDKRIQGFKDLTYEEFLQIAREFLGKDNKQRLAILLEGNTSTPDFHYRTLSNPQELRNLSHYTSLSGEEENHNGSHSFSLD